MGISNSVGSNSFDILICMGLPWLIKAAAMPEIPPGRKFCCSWLWWCGYFCCHSLHNQFGSLLLHILQQTPSGSKNWIHTSYNIHYFPSSCWMSRAEYLFPCQPASQPTLTSTFNTRMKILRKSDIFIHENEKIKIYDRITFKRLWYTNWWVTCFLRDFHSENVCR